MVAHQLGLEEVVCSVQIRLTFSATVSPVLVLCPRHIHRPWCAELSRTLESVKTSAGGDGYYYSRPNKNQHSQSCLVDPHTVLLMLVQPRTVNFSKLTLTGTHVSVNIFLHLLWRKKHFETSNFCNRRILTDSGKQHAPSRRLAAAELISPHGALGDTVLL